MNQEKPVEAPAQPFAPQTLLNATPAGVQVIANIAPQTSIVVLLTVEQLAPALKQCLVLRQNAGKVDQAAIDTMLRRKDLKLA